LIESEAFKQLRHLAMECVLLIESRYHQMHLAGSRDADGAAARAKASVSELLGQLEKLQTNLTTITPGTGSRPSKVGASTITTNISEVLDVLGKAQKNIDEIASQNTVYRGLATVGIASAVFGHETEISTDLVQGELTIAKISLDTTEPDVESALAALTNAEKYLQQVAGWGKFALLRVKKDKRKRKEIDVAQLVRDVLAELEAPLKESGITLRRSLKNVQARTFPMDIEAILVNFVTNGYHAVKKTRTGRTILVQLRPQKYEGKDGFELSVQDSGPGFPKESSELIWQPLYSTRQKGGTGLGLTIVRSAVLELGGRVSAEPAGALGGATFNAWLPNG
jgi:signal transduction histidine kinase